MIDLTMFTFLKELIPIYAFLAGALLGENAPMGFAFLYTQNITPLIGPLIYSFVGIVLMDYLFFLTGRTKKYDHLIQKKFFKKCFKRVDKTVTYLTKNHPFRAMFYIKVVFGTKFLVSSYLGKKGMKHTTFLLSAVLSTLAWMAITVPLGYFGGRGLTWIIDVVQNIPVAMMSFGAIFFLGIQIHKKVHNHIIKKHGGKIKNAKLPH